MNKILILFLSLIASTANAEDAFSAVIIIQDTTGAERHFTYKGLKIGENSKDDTIEFDDGTGGKYSVGNKASIHISLQGSKVVAKVEIKTSKFASVKDRTVTMESQIVSFTARNDLNKAFHEEDESFKKSPVKIIVVKEK